MNEEHQENLRDLVAMFALNALIQRPEVNIASSAERRANLCMSAYEWADSLISTKDGLNGVGIASAKRKRK